MTALQEEDMTKRLTAGKQMTQRNDCDTSHRATHHPTGEYQLAGWSAMADWRTM